MNHYFWFVLIATITVLSPGPGVMLTLTNAARFGIKGAINSILGIASGSFIVAGISATSLGLLLATSVLAFTIVKYMGAAYLIYLGLKLWRGKKIDLQPTGVPSKTRYRLFMEGLMLQLTNPKAVFFFMSIFPQFIDYSTHNSYQFVLLVATYSSLIIIIHLLYASLAHSVRTWLATDRGSRLMNRIGAGTFIGFGIGLAVASK